MKESSPKNLEKYRKLQKSPTLGNICSNWKDKERNRLIFDMVRDIFMTTDDFPEPEVILEMEPEQLAPFVLRRLQKATEARESINRGNFTNINDSSLYQRLGTNAERYAKKLMEAWISLEQDVLVAPIPNHSGNDGWYYVTDRGVKILNATDFEAFKQARLFPSEGFDPVLAKAVKILFLSGDYETAVFRAFKEVEMRVRDRAGLGLDVLGVELMEAAFKKEIGPLTDKSLPLGEQDAIRFLFRGSIGTFKNPASHRAVQFENPKEVIDVISLANHLLRIVERF